MPGPNWKTDLDVHELNEHLAAKLRTASEALVDLNQRHKRVLKSNVELRRQAATLKRRMALACKVLQRSGDGKSKRV